MVTKKGKSITIDFILNGGEIITEKEIEVSLNKEKIKIDLEFLINERLFSLKGENPIDKILSWQFTGRPNKDGNFEGTLTILDVEKLSKEHKRYTL